MQSILHSTTHGLKLPLDLFSFETFSPVIGLWRDGQVIFVYIAVLYIAEPSPAEQLTDGRYFLQQIWQYTVHSRFEIELTETRLRERSSTLDYR